MEELFKLLSVEDKALKDCIRGIMNSPDHSDLNNNLKVIVEIAKLEGTISTILKQKNKNLGFDVPDDSPFIDLALHGYYSTELSCETPSFFDQGNMEKTLNTDFHDQDFVASYKVNGYVEYFDPTFAAGWNDWNDDKCPSLTVYAKRRHSTADQDSADAVRIIAGFLGDKRELPSLEEMNDRGMAFDVMPAGGISGRALTEFVMACQSYGSEIEMGYERAAYVVIDGETHQVSDSHNDRQGLLDRGTPYFSYFRKGINPKSIVSIMTCGIPYRSKLYLKFMGDEPSREIVDKITESLRAEEYADSDISKI